MNTKHTDELRCCKKCEAQNGAFCAFSKCSCHTTDEWEKEFMKELGTYTNEYSYVHKIPNCDKIIDFIRTLLSTLLTQAEEEKQKAVEEVQREERERIMHEINAKVDNLSRCPEKPQRRSAFQDGFSDCLDQVMLILGKKVVCTNCMDRGYVKNILFDFLEKCDHPSHITPTISSDKTEV